MTDDLESSLAGELSEVVRSAGSRGREHSIPPELHRRVERRRRRGPKAAKVVAAAMCVASVGVLVSRIDVNLSSRNDQQASSAQPTIPVAVAVTRCAGTDRADVVGRGGSTPVPRGFELYSDGSTTVLAPAGWMCDRADTYDSAVLQVFKNKSARGESVTVQYAHVNSSTGMSMVCRDFGTYGLSLDLTKATVDSFDCAASANHTVTAVSDRVARFVRNSAAEPADSGPEAVTAGSVIHNHQPIDTGRIAQLTCNLRGANAETMCSEIRSDYEQHRFSTTAALIPRWTRIPIAGSTIASRAVVLDGDHLRFAYTAADARDSLDSSAVSFRSKMEGYVRQPLSNRATSLFREAAATATSTTIASGAKPQASVPQTAPTLAAAVANALSKTKKSMRVDGALVDDSGVVYVWGDRATVKIDSSGSIVSLSALPSPLRQTMNAVIGRSLFVWGGTGTTLTEGTFAELGGESGRGYFMYFG